jgi:glutamyl-tRNA synthetase
MPQKVRVRFAPSPTGPLHIGGVRTALYNYLFARRHGGDFILRIEDTDSSRLVPGAEQYNIESFRWCGIEFDEGVDVGGPHAPYRQSERKPIYKQYADKLIADGKAYFAFDSPEELDKMRKELEQSKASNTSYSSHVRGKMKNSFTMPASEVKKLIDSGTQYVIRILMPDNEEITAFDEIRKTVQVNTSTLDDKVLWKSSDGLPTYHLANIVDDHLMEITHVIRGEEWLPSLPLHLLLYRYLGWESTMPKFAHLPLLLKPDGKGKLSKRDGDKLGFPVFPIEWEDPANGEISTGYRESGYFPDAFLNFLALLGWNPGNEQELFSVDELVQTFSLEHVGKAGARFDFEKAKWFNHQYLIQKSNEEIASLFLPILRAHGVEKQTDFITHVCGLLKERVNFVKEIWDQGFFFFIAPDQYNKDVVSKSWKPDTPAILDEITEVLDNLTDFSVQSVNNALHNYAAGKQIGLGQVMIPLRISLVGSGIGPDLPVIVAMLGKEEVLKRIKTAVKKIIS